MGAVALVRVCFQEGCQFLPGYMYTHMPCLRVCNESTPQGSHNTRTKAVLEVRVSKWNGLDTFQPHPPGSSSGSGV